MKLLTGSELTALKLEYEKYDTLIKQKDSVTEPFKSKYEALECLENMKEKLVAVDECAHKSAIECAILTGCGVIKTETEELTAGEELLTKSLEISESISDERFSLLSKLRALIYLGVIWCGREQYESARGYLEKALKVYKFFQEENCQEIYSFKDLVDDSNDGYKSGDQVDQAESLITHSYFYLAQVEGKAGNSQKSASLCLTTLARQLKSPDFDWRDWTCNCAGLADFYLNRDSYKAARYCISAALAVLDKHKAEDKAGELDEDVGNKSRRSEAMVDRHCVKYALALMEYSHLSKLQEMDGETAEEIENPDEIEEFDNLDVTSQLEQVTDEKFKSYADAKGVFVWAQKHVQSAQLYFTLDERCSDYVELARDMSQLYKHLSFFEPDDENKCKMHRRRVDILEPLNRDLSPTYYLLIIRQILFELGEIFSDMVDIKRKRWQAEPANPHYAKKVNTLVKQSILYFETFLDTMRVEGKRPEKYNDESVRPALLAHFYIGRMYSKFIVVPNSHDELNNISQTCQSYKNIVDYCDKYPDALSKVVEEVTACREMVKLLPLKMEQIRRSLTL